MTKQFICDAPMQNKSPGAPFRVALAQAVERSAPTAQCTAVEVGTKLGRFDVLRCFFLPSFDGLMVQNKEPYF